MFGRGKILVEVLKELWKVESSDKLREVKKKRHWSGFDRCDSGRDIRPFNAILDKLEVIFWLQEWYDSKWGIVKKIRFLKNILAIKVWPNSSA
jgi:hypothetical protein